jgi:hypothetical protein
MELDDGIEDGGEHGDSESSGCCGFRISTVSVGDDIVQDSILH